MSDYQYYPIQGIPVPAGKSTPLRQEVTEWSNDHPIQLSLFLQALVQFYELQFDERESYFAIAGIHGYPAVPWDNAPPPAIPNPGNPKENLYCTHRRNTFPTWHRPYMLLFEQRIHELMYGIVSKIPRRSDHDKWAVEASEWRLPYWDWARNQAYLVPPSMGVPEVFTKEIIDVVMPNTKGTVPFKNPLVKYTTSGSIEGKPMGDPSLGKYAIKHSIADKDKQGNPIYYPWNKCVGTSRWAVTQESPEKREELSIFPLWINGINNWPRSNAAMQIPMWYKDPVIGHFIPDAVYRMLSDEYLKNWDTFSTTAYGPKDTESATEYLSLEFIHNNLHNFTGGESLAWGAGQMADVPVSSFDPIFFMHHCNIDRLLATWQILNPKKWFNGDETHHSDLLEPFHKTVKGDSFVSDDIQDWTKFGYQYDTLQRYRGESDQQYVARIRKEIEVLYHNTGDDLLGAPKDVAGHLSHVATTKASDEGNVYNDFLINIRYDPFAHSGLPYVIHFFIGQVQDHEITGQHASTHARYVGCVYNFVGGYSEQDSVGCENCKKQKKEGALSRARIPLTMTLLHHAQNRQIPELNSLDVEPVTEYLENHLTWKVVTATGRILDINDLPETKVFVFSGKGEHFQAADRMSRYHSYVPMSSVTHGKDGGAKHHDY